jgi:hypothetical protein
MSTTHDTPPEDEMPAEIDFLGSTRGKFYRPNLYLIPPPRLEPEVPDFLATRAQERGSCSTICSKRHGAAPHRSGVKADARLRIQENHSTARGRRARCV